MARGYYNGSDWVPYSQGQLSHSTATSREEFRMSLKHKSREIRNHGMKSCPICNKSQDLHNSHCIKCNYKFNTKGLDSVIYTGNLIKSKADENKKAQKSSNINTVKSSDKNEISTAKNIIKFQKLTSEKLFNSLTSEFTIADYIKWDKESIPLNYNNKLKRYFNNDSKICFSKVTLENNDELYLFTNKKERFSRLTLVFSVDIKKSNFRVKNDELLILLEINHDELKNHFNLKCKSKKLDLYYLSLGNLSNGNLSKNIELLINEFGDSFYNQLLNTFEFNKSFDFEAFK